MAVTATVQPYVSQPVSAFTTHKTISLDVDGTAGTVPVSLGVGSSTQFQDIGASVLANAVILAPDSATRNTIQPTADANEGLIIQPHSATHSVALLDVQMTGGGSYFAVNPISAGTPLVSINSPSNQDKVLFSVTTGNGQSLFNVATFSAFDAAGNYLGEMYLKADCSLEFWHPTNVAGFDEKAGSIHHAMSDNTDATFKGRMTYTAWDFNAERECLRLEATGTAAAIGFLGASAVVRQTNGTAAALAAITDANAKAFLTAVSNGLVNLGLFNAPA